MHWACAATREDSSPNVEDRSARIADALLAAGADAHARNVAGATPQDVGVGDKVKQVLASAMKAQEERELKEVKAGLEQFGSGASPSLPRSALGECKSSSLSLITCYACKAIVGLSRSG